jgi:predicted membrane-bound dolichyl-phosphate-mannose-protein mannosyltransferase
MILLLVTSPSLCAGGTQSPAAGGGSQGAQQWTRYDWNAASGKSGPARFEIEQGKDGVLLRIIAATPNDARFVHEVAVEPQTLYRIACRARSKEVGSGARGAGISVSAILEGSPDIKGSSNEWQTLEFYGRTGPDQQKLLVTVGIGGYGSLNSGTAWFKDVTVTKVGNAPAGIPIGSLRPQTAAAPVSAGGKGGMVIAVLGCFGVLLVVVGTIIRRRGGDAEERVPDIPLQAAAPRERVERRDVAVMGAMTVVCLMVSLFNLGGHVAPESGWQAAKAGESVTIELGREVDLSRIYYYCGINDRSGDGSRYTFAARNPAGAFVGLASFAKDDSGIWKFSEVAVRTSAVRLTADTPGGRLNEIAFVERGNLSPLTGLRISQRNVFDSDQGKPENLIDEQSSFEYSPSFQTGFYFDEIYHARSAWEMLNRIEPYETTHPPLGKLLIASGIALFGMNPFGWRVVGTLFGVALVPLLYLFGLKLFRNSYYAFASAFLMMVEFMRFAQSRVAVIDVYGVFFILVMYYFILDLFPEGGGRPHRNVNRTLFLAGVAFGIGAACKWIALYAGCGMVLLVVLRTAADLRQRDVPTAWGASGFLLRRIAVCLVAFGAVPSLIYLLAYLPYLALPGPGHGLADVFRLQAHMLNYHRTLQATHPFSSHWWSWPLDLRPMWMYSGAGLPVGTVSTIVSFGNPAIFWLGIPCVASAAFLAVHRHDAGMGVVLTALFFQYLPWVGINRLAFIYHFFSSVPFMILCIVATVKNLELRYPRFRAVTWGYLGIAAGLFIIFYPVLSGMPVPQTYVASLRWLPTWLF